MTLSNDQLRERLRTYAAEFAELCRSNLDRERLLNGFDDKHGLNHLIEIVQMLPSGNSAEFVVRE